MWVAVLVGSLGCYLLKLAGLTCRRRGWSTRWCSGWWTSCRPRCWPRWSRCRWLTSGSQLVVDGRLAGLAVAAVALALRAPFVVVLVLAGLTGAGVHWLGSPA